MVRWVGYIVVIVATVSWLYTNQQVTTPKRSNVMERMTPKQINLPAEDVTNTIRDAISAVTQKTPNFGPVDKVDPALIVLDPTILEDKEHFATLFVSAIFLGSPQKYTIINGAVYREKDELPDGRVVKEIDADGVSVGLDGSSERVNWIPPYRVELKKPAATAGVSVLGVPGATDEATLTETEQTPAVDLNNLPPDLTPDQALQILQQVGKQQ